MNEKQRISVNAYGKNSVNFKQKYRTFNVRYPVISMLFLSRVLMSRLKTVPVNLQGIDFALATDLIACWTSHTWSLLKWLKTIDFVDGRSNYLRT